MRRQDGEHPRAERAPAPDEVLPQPALRLVDAQGDGVAERRRHEPRGHARLVEAVAELVQAAVQRAREVVQVVARGDPRVAAADALGERVRRGVEPPAVRVEADALEHRHRRAALILDLVLAGEHVRPLARRARRRVDERPQALPHGLEQGAQPRGRHLRLEVVEQHVVRVRGAREARRVAVAELEMGREGVPEAREVRRRARLLPRRLADRRRAAHLRRERRGDAHGLLHVAPEHRDQAHVVRVRILAGCPRLEGVEQLRQLGLAHQLVGDGLERRLLVAARLGTVRRHHRVLVPEEEGLDAPEPRQHLGALAQGGERGWDGLVRWLHAGRG